MVISTTEIEEQMLIISKINTLTQVLKVCSDQLGILYTPLTKTCQEKLEELIPQIKT